MNIYIHDPIISRVIESGKHNPAQVWTYSCKDRPIPTQLGFMESAGGIINRYYYLYQLQTIDFDALYRVYI